MSATAQRAADPDFERSVRIGGRRLAEALPGALHHPVAHLEQRLMAALVEQPELRAALFRFVDVRPACRDDSDVARHLAELLEEALGERTGDERRWAAGPARARDGTGDERRAIGDGRREGERKRLRGAVPARAAASLARRRGATAPVARVASLGVRQLAHRFIAGEDPADALDVLGGLWRDGIATSVDLLGEATVTAAEADRYAARCVEALRTLEAAARRWPVRPALERDSAGPIARVNLSVKVSALTARLRPHAPERAIADAVPRLRSVLRCARELGAHVHVDVESLDTREAVVGLVRKVLAEPEFADGPSAGIVVQAYLLDAPRHVEELLDWAAATPRATPLTIRLVKGAYWDHELVQAAQHGWAPPVHTDRRDTDRAYEALTRRLIDAFPQVRLAVASHNLRSLAHAIAYADARGLQRHDVECQVLRGLGDDVAQALRADDRRVRCYSPVGDLVAGMGYLVRRLLENTANDSFLAARASGRDVEALLEAP